MHKKEETGFPLKTVALCSLSGTGLFFLFLILFSFLILKTSANQSMYLLYGIIAGAVSAFICGFAGLKIIKEKGLLHGAICGGAQAFICTLIIFILNKGTAGNGIFILMGIIVLMSSLGGMAGVNIKKKIKY